jgi:hypothetical protein
VEGESAIDTSRVRAGLERLADQRSGQKKKKSRPAKGDHVIFRVRVVSADGTNETLNILLDPGHKRQPEPLLERIADQLHVGRDQLEEVLDSWDKSASWPTAPPSRRLPLSRRACERREPPRRASRFQAWGKAA